MRTEILPRRPALHTLTITIPSPTETVQGSPVLLPDAEPANPQLTWTVAAADLASLSENIVSWISTATWILSGKNTDTSARTVYFRVKRNGGSIWTGNASVIAGRYWTLNFGANPVAVGDVFTAYMWASVANVVDWRYDAHQGWFSRLMPCNRYEILGSYSTGTWVKYPTSLSLGGAPAPAGNWLPNWAIEKWDKLIQVTIAALDISALVPNWTEKLYCSALADGDKANTGTILTHATSRPYYYQQYFHTVHRWRNLGRVVPGIK